MKNYLLTGGFAAILLLAACGNEEEVAQSEESTEEVTEEQTKEESTTEEQSETATTEEELEDDIKIYAENTEQVTEDIEALKVTREGAAIGGVEVDEEMAWYFEDEGYSIGDEVQILTIEYTVENTVDEQRDFYLDQTTLITSTGEQIESEWLVESGLQSEMKGAVKSSGEIMFLLRNGDAEDIEWVDVIMPPVSDAEWNSLTDEYKQRIEF